MKEIIVVKNFEKYQHYSDRPLIWIKLYRDLLNDFKFMQMPPDIRWVLMGLWLLASETGNKTELDRDAIAWRINVDSILLAHSLKLLIDGNFIRIDSIEIGESQHDASTEKIRVEEKRIEREEKKKEVVIEGALCPVCKKWCAEILEPMKGGIPSLIKCQKCGYTNEAEE